MSPKSSIRRRLAVFLIAGVTLILAVTGALLAVSVRGWLVRDFDAALEAKALALATLTRQDRRGVELDFADEIMPEFEATDDPWYFELWHESGLLLERSRSFPDPPERTASLLGRQAIPEDRPRFTNLTLPDGRPGRVVQIDFVPQAVQSMQAETEHLDRFARAPTLLPRESTLATASLLMARGRAPLDGELRAMYAGMAGMLLLVAGAMILLVRISLRRELRPLLELSGGVSRLHAGALAERIALSRVPDEVRPVVDQINSLLARLEQAFDRERQLTSDIAHELKTPIAELRSLCEVGAHWPEDRAVVEGFFDDALAVALQMERIVVHLLALNRSEAGVEAPRNETVDLGEIVERAWRPYQALAAQRRLDLELDVGPVSVYCDPSQLAMMVSNLLSNAVDYSPDGSEITCRASVREDRVILAVTNLASGLEAADLERMFDRFWRKDASRGGGRNVGLGLAIVKAFGDLQGIGVSAHLDAESTLTVTLSCPLAVPPVRARPS